METIFFLLSIIIIALIVHTLMTRGLPKRKAQKRRQDKLVQRELSDDEIILLHERAIYEHMLTRLSDDSYSKPYPELSDLTYFDAQKFDDYVTTKASIQERIRDINQELMRLKAFDK